MTRKATPLTPDQVKEQFRRRGVTLTDWARERGFPRQAVYRVLNGQLKANFGVSHEIAVALGMKVAEDVDVASAKPSTPAAGRNAQSKQAA